jgi:transposase
MEKQKYTREGLIHLCKTQPEAAADLILLLLDRVDKLEARVIELEIALNQNSQNSHKPPSSDGYRRNLQTSTPKNKKRPTGGQSGHPGTTLRKSAIVDHVVIHPVDTCIGCGSSLEHIPVQDVRTRQVFDLPTVKMEVTEHRSEVKQCPCCHTQTAGTFPPGITKATQYGSTLKSIVVYMMQHQIVPFERTTEFLQDIFGCTLSEGTLKNWTAEVYRHLTQAEEQIKEQLQHAKILHVDETGIFCSLRGASENKLHWIHSASTEIYTHYGIHTKRGKEGMDDIGILPDATGRLIHDFWESYGRYDNVTHAYCNAHIVRELRSVYQDYHQVWAQKLIDLLFHIKQKVETKPISKNFGTRSLHRYDALLQSGFRLNRRNRGSPHKRGRVKQSKPRNLLERLHDHRDEILAFLFDPTVPFTNNLAERDLRMVKVKQKISGTFRSHLGALYYCRIRGYISTMKKQSVNILDALSSVFAGNPLSPIPQLR